MLKVASCSWSSSWSDIINARLREQPISMILEMRHFYFLVFRWYAKKKKHSFFSYHQGNTDRKTLFQINIKADTSATHTHIHWKWYYDQCKLTQDIFHIYLFWLAFNHCIICFDFFLFFFHFSYLHEYFRSNFRSIITRPAFCFSFYDSLRVHRIHDQRKMTKRWVFYCCSN